MADILNDAALSAGREGFGAWQPPSDMDKECVSICRAMNRVPGIRTVESCCGHGSSDFRVWFDVDHLDYLPDLLYWFDSCHCGLWG